MKTFIFKLILLAVTFLSSISFAETYVIEKNCDIRIKNNDESSCSCAEGLAKREADQLCQSLSPDMRVQVLQIHANECNQWANIVLSYYKATYTCAW